MMMTDKGLCDTIVDYWDSQPCNSLHSSKSSDSLDYFLDITKKRYLVEPHIRKFANFENWSGKRVLEIGSGIGTDGAEFARNGAEYVGIDISKQSVALSSKRFRLENLPGTFHVKNAADVRQLNDLGKFDLVYSFGVIHHWPDPNAIISTVQSLLNPGGWLKFMVYARNSWKWAMIQQGIDQFEAKDNVPYATTFTMPEVEDLLKSRFNITSLTQDHCFMYNVEKYKKGEYKLEPWFEAMSEDMKAAIKTHLGWHLLVTAQKKDG
jgi:2-polyprenyl-3-methyl-5-hydroxy-6-metoxy-1,4-benzoquinol methylase